MLDLLDDGLDELAINDRGGIGSRVVAALGGGLIGLTCLPWPVCAIWFVSLAGVDIIGWAFTRKRLPGVAAAPLSRMIHAGLIVLESAGWTLLGVMFWLTGSISGCFGAVIVWLSLLAVAQVLAFQSRAAFLITCSIPAAGILLTTLLAPSPSIPNGLATWLALLVCAAFTISSARYTMRARQRYDRLSEDYRLLANNITDVITLVSPDDQWLYVSPSVEQLLGYSLGELMLEPSFSYRHPDDDQMIDDFMKSVAIGSAPRTIEYRVFAKTGEMLWLETTFSRLKDGSDRLLGVSRDVSHRKVLEAELTQAVACSEAAAAAKTDFLANMTHELRTPLTAILGFSGVLRQSKSLSVQDTRHVGLIHDASQTLLGVVGDVLDFSKLEAGGLELNPQPFDPAAAVRSAGAIVADQAAAKNLPLTLQIDETVPKLIGDAPRLRQVVLNLLSNAIKFTGSGGVELALSYRVEAGRCHLRVKVRDSGIGIPEDQLDSVFMRFTQADASISRHFGGTGLGLAISKQIIEIMGGRIGVLSLVGQGSTFWFEIPLPLAGDQDVGDEPGQITIAFDRPIRILVVEDNAANRELIGVLLGSFDIEIETAANGAEAVAAVGRQTYDLILMDMQMPVMDGLTATRRIRALDSDVTARTPIIAMTANILPEQIARCREAGMDDHLGKPINSARLIRALDRWASGDAARAM